MRLDQGYKSEQEFAFIVDSAERGQRLDAFLSSKMKDHSRTSLQRAIDAGAVTVNGSMGKSGQKMQAGDLVHIALQPPGPSQVTAEEIPLDIVYEDNDLLVLNKPKNMVVHPAPGAEEGTLVNALLAHCNNLSGVGGELRPGIVHRLDKDTSGLMMVAKNDVAHHGLQEQIQKRTAKRRYMALVWGRPPWNEAVIDAPVSRHPNDPRRMAIAPPNSRAAARHAITEVTVRERLGLFTLLECNLQTGRTHQIRLHCEFAGYPVVGDPIYGGLRRVPNSAMEPKYASSVNERIADLNGQLLHAYALSFVHPTSGKKMEFEQPLHDEFQAFLDFLRSLPEEYRG
ncbi:MAG: RluA family pseudouridine synthase [Armatimonadaceae bacterium]